ncbi:hypothetical protein BC938DRAFT_475017 [Jimgerdemannia flammicorona]|uniref:Nucleoporin Nup133/Nup155-like C-terminal domain-containing protein n=1 Tax=Jimgerdemannia flammicorona TaxID=994334 RepID=A0A433Q120_9FUNG|nr:hypothetical protein BC938DRAFT_475017 [Jimgerdemannia flammicorona]
MLSISKLAFLATVEYDELNNEDIHTIQEEIDDKLDVLTINSQLMQVFQNELKDGGPSLLDGKVKVVVDSLAAALKAHEKFAFEELFSQLVKVLLVGNSILGEDLIDALTLKNNHKCAVDYLYAIEVYRRAKDLPEARREAALKTAWRRTFLHDDWESLSISKGLTDEQRRELLMKTAVFKVLSTAYQQNIEKEYLLKPSECYFTSPRDDLRARFQGMPDHQLDTLVNDYQIENKQLDLNINQFGLADLYEEIRDLEERQRTGGYPLEV